MEDESIVQLYWQRDEAAISETGIKYGKFCQRISMNILSVREDAEECVNDTYQSVWNAVPTDRPRSLTAYLGRIIRNLSINRWNRNHAQKRHDGMEILLSELEGCIPSNESLERSIEDRELSELVTKWLKGLPAADRALFVRRYWHGDALGPLAAESGVSPQKLAQKMLRLRGSLKALLEREGVAL
jgi:RNA polymerase sigma-70 factor (ECF subfamily)